MAKRKAKKMVKKSMHRRKDGDHLGNYLFIGSLILGIGAGLYYGRPEVGVLAGLGVGFILKGISLSRKK